MPIPAGTRRRVALLLRALGATALIGAALGGANGYGFRDAPLLGAMLGALGGGDPIRPRIARYAGAVNVIRLNGCTEGAMRDAIARSATMPFAPR
jgi:hypothetical protein